MKPRRSTSSASRKKSGGGTLLGLFIGLVIGVLAAAGVVWYIFKTPTPFTNKGQPSPVPPPVAQPAGAAPAPVAAAPMALPGKPGDPIPQAGDNKPRFDFYKILPGNSDATPDPKQTEPKPTDTAKGKAEKDKSETALKEPVYLQTGSFQSAADADGQKAKLAMMGVEASVQQVMLQDKVWYRVRLGPFKKAEDVHAMRADLAKQGIEANAVKKD
ncbi:MAG: Sporulation domain protein [Proteobacteria bacterium]|nr:Sporulation domain protein [Pseudomonadota bacterium]